MKNFGLFLYCFIPVALAMAFGAYFNNEAIDSWYQTLQKPMLTPPDYVFPIVWNTIYLMIIITFFIAFKTLTDSKDILTAKKIFFRTADFARFVDFFVLLSRTNRPRSVNYHHS